MNIIKAMALINKYSVCQKCGSDKVASGEGTLNITETSFERTCKCGWSVREVEQG